MAETPVFDPVSPLASELGLDPKRIAAAVRLLDEGNTVPFVARYRKEVTGELDEVQLRIIEERCGYLRELEERRQTVLSSIDEQEKLTDELREQILAATTKAALEDLYLPYRPKRRTRATVARERGLEPLAERILEQPSAGDPIAEAQAFLDPDKEIADAEAALAGARDIVAELLSERADIRARVRRVFAADGMLVVEAAPGARDKPTKFEQYYEHREPVAKIPSHRYLAIRRGEREEILRSRIQVEADDLFAFIMDRAGRSAGSPFCEQLDAAAFDAFSRLIAPSVETDVRAELKERSDRAAVEVFASNLRNLLMAAPLGGKPVIGVDPGLRTGCKVAAVDHTGQFLANTTLFLSRSDAEKKKAKAEVLTLLDKHPAAAMAVGNGTGGRDAEQFLREIISEAKLSENPEVIQVNEAGASVYSASEIAGQEFPDLDVTVRGAISIARRLQDPLAELVKIEPKAIGVGQYQHDVHQPLLGRKLDEVVESCVNQVGVELNTASAALLARVAGVGPKLADKVVTHRDENGSFACRKDLLGVSGLGPKTFEQAAGFLRIRGGSQPLDASAVHPERYELVEQMAKDLGAELSSLVGDARAASKIQIANYVSDQVGEPTLKDIVVELAKPGRDPRAVFEPVRFKEGVKKIGDLKVGMTLEGVVTNVTAFGAFVDIGVHRDGLVHISQLADQFVEDPHQVVKVGDKLKVRVVEADVERDRISLSARSEQPAEKKPRPARPKGKPDARSDAKPGGGRPQKSRTDARGDRRSAKPRRDDRRPRKPRRDDRPRTPRNAEDDKVLTHNPFADLLKKL